MSHPSEPVSVMVCYSKCWSCAFGQCPGGWHTWADSDDVEHALATGRPDPSGGKCGCPCASGPEIEHDGPPDLDEPVSLNTTPCPICGESGACSYDADGRPLIHAFIDEDAP